MAALPRGVLDAALNMEDRAHDEALVNDIASRVSEQQQASQPAPQTPSWSIPSLSSLLGGSGDDQPEQTGMGGAQPAQQQPQAQGWQLPSLDVLLGRDPNAQPATTATRGAQNPLASASGTPAAMPSAGSATGGMAADGSQSDSGSVTQGPRTRINSALDVTPDEPVTSETVTRAAAAALTRAGLPADMAPYIAGIAINEGILQPGTIARDNWSVGGVKAPGSAGVVTVPTREVINGQSVMQTASFGTFNSMQEGMDALAEFVRDSPRFGPVAQQAAQTGDYSNLIAGFKERGYATDPNWVQQVNSIAAGLRAPRVQQAAPPADTMARIPLTAAPASSPAPAAAAPSPAATGVPPAPVAASPYPAAPWEGLQADAQSAPLMMKAGEELMGPGDGGYAPQANEQPYDPDQGPREAVPGSVGAQPLPQTPNPMSYGPIEQSDTEQGPAVPAPQTQLNRYVPSYAPQAAQVAPTMPSPAANAVQAGIDAGVEAYNDPFFQAAPQPPRWVKIVSDAMQAFGAESAKNVARSLGVTDDEWFNVFGYPISRVDVAGFAGGIAADPTTYVGADLADPLLTVAKGAVKDFAPAAVQNAGRAVGNAVREGADALGRGLQGVGREVAGGLLDLNPGLTPRMAEGGGGIGRAMASGARDVVDRRQTLDADVLTEELQAVGARINDDGTVTLYHRTTPEAAQQIQASGVFRGKEDGIFFSTRPDGQTDGYGSAVVEARVPIRDLLLDDAFDNEAHLRVPTRRAGVDYRGASVMAGDAGPGIGRAMADAGGAAQVPERPLYSPEQPPGVQRRYHGTAGAFDAPDPARFNEDGLYGPGYYLTSDPRVASNYGLERATSAGPAGANVRAIDVPAGVNLLDMSAPLDDTVLARTRQAIRETMTGPRAQIGRGLENEIDELADEVAHRAANRLEPLTNDDLYTTLRDAVTPMVGASRGTVTDVLERAGWDGIAHRGGQRTPTIDASGAVIEHDVTVIFPDKLDRITNAFSGTRGGATLGVSPGLRGAGIGSQLATDIGNSIGGGVAGAAYSMATGDEENLGRNVTAGMVGAPLLGRGMRRAGGALGTPGIGPNGRPSKPTVEVLQQELDFMRSTIGRARAEGNADLEKRAIDRAWQLESELVDARNARKGLEPAITSDQGRRIESLPLDERSADDFAGLGRERVSAADAADLGGPASVVPERGGRMNAAPPYTERGAGIGTRIAADAGASIQGAIGGEIYTEATGDQENRARNIAIGAAGMPIAGRLVGRGMRNAGPGMRTGIVPPHVASDLFTSPRGLDDALLATAVEKTPGAALEPNGVRINLERWQKPEQAAQPATRNAVLYSAGNTSESKGYRGGGASGWYGGEQQIKGDTLLTSPLTVRAKPGGDLALAAWDAMNGRGARKELERDVLSVAGPLSRWGLPPETPPYQLKNQIKTLLTQKYDWDVDEAADVAERIVANSTKGNQLQFSLQEAIVSHAARFDGHDGIIGVNARGRMSEIYDLRETHNPTPEGGFAVNPEFIRPGQESGPLGDPAATLASRTPSLNSAIPGFDPASAAMGGLVGSQAEGEDGETGDPLRTLGGAAFAGMAGRMGRKPGHTVATGLKPGQRYEFRVRVVPLRDLITSHLDNLSVNRAFPGALQPRVRERAASRVQIDKMVQAFDPEQVLMDTHRVDSGPMIVGPDMVVESGNGRGIALRRLSQENPEAYANYVQALREELPYYGLTEDALQGIDQPVLVRERITPLDDAERARFATEANAPTAAQMSSMEQAMADARSIGDGPLGRIVVGDDQTIDEALLAPENGAFVRAFMATVPDTERGKMLEANGNLSVTGLARVKAALLARTYPGAAGERVATAIVESTDAGLRNVQNAVMGSLPSMARVEGLVASGDVDAGLSLAGDVAAAVDVYARLKRAGILVGDYLQQSGMFGGRETTPLQDAILGYLNDNARAPRRLRALLEGYAREVEGVAGAADDMFGGPATTATKEELVDGVLRRLGADPADQGADLGRVGAGSNVVEGSGQRQLAVPPADTGAQAGRGAGIPSLIEDVNAAESLTPEQQIARLQAENDRLRAERRGGGRRQQAQQPAPLQNADLPPVADDLIPSTGGEAGNLQVQGAPAAQPARPGPVGQIAPTGGATGTLQVQGAPQPMPRPGPIPQGMLPTGGAPGTLANPGAPVAPTPLQPANLPPVGQFAAPPVPNIPGVQNAVSGAQQRAAALAARGQAPLSPLQWMRRLAGEASYSSMIGPATFSVNLVGNVLEPLWAAPKELARAASRGNMREAGAMAAGTFNGLGDVWGAVKDAMLARGQYAATPGHEPLSAQTINPIGHAVATGLEVGGRFWSGVPDAIFGTIARGAGEARAAAQLATNDGLKGAAWSQRVTDLLEDAKAVRGGGLPALAGTQQIMDEGAAYAKRQTFQNELGTIGTKVKDWATIAVVPDGKGGRSPLPVVGNMATPFFNTPWNMNNRLAERTPIVGAFMNTQRGFDKKYDQVMGTAVVAGMVGYAATGHVTGSGPSDPQKRKELEAEGWRPYSTLIGGVYIPNRVVGVFGPLLNAVGDTHDAIAYAKDRKDWGAIGSDYAARLGKQLQQQPYLQGLADLIGAMEAGQQGGLGSATERYVASNVTRLIPYAATARTIGTMQDPTDRTVDRGKETPPLTTIGQMVRGGVGNRQGFESLGQTPLPEAQDVLGRTKDNPQAGLGALFARTGAQRSDPLVRAYLDAGVNISQAPTDIDGVPLTPAQQRQYLSVMGRELQRIAGPTVAGGSWASMPPQVRKSLLETFQTTARTLAETSVSASAGPDFARQRAQKSVDKALGR